MLAAPSTPRRAVVGRETERERLRALLTSAAAGQGAALVVRGEPGIGKSTLLDDAAARARGDGMRVLSARGLETEAELPYAGLHALLHPVLERAAALTRHQRRMLEAALGLRPPRGDARLAVAGSVLGLLAAAAGEHPLLCVVDDAHWLDAASAETLAFVARRVADEPLVLLFGTRDGDPRTFAPRGLPELVLDGLRLDSARELLADTLAPELVAELHRVVRGNPLALLELVQVVRDREREGLPPLVEPLPLTEELQRAFADRLRPLPPETRALLLLAAAGDGRVATVVEAAGRLGLDAAALAPAERAGLVAAGGEAIAFRHPLVRAAACAAAAPDERRRAHAALAAATRDDDSAAWQLAAAALGLDESAAAALEAAGERAHRRAAYAAAASAYERAATLTPCERQRAVRLERAALAAVVGGEPARALALVDRALPLAGDAVLEADVALVEANAAFGLDLPRALAAAERGMAAVAAVDRRRADHLMFLAVTFARMLGDAAAAEACYERGRALGLGRARQPATAAVIGWTLGRERWEARSLASIARSAARELDRADRRALLPFVYWGFAELAVRVDERAAALELVEAILRATGGAGLDSALWTRARCAYQEGRWAEARALLAQAGALGEEHGNARLAFSCQFDLAELAAYRGAKGELEEHLAAVRRLAKTPYQEAWIEALRGLAELSLGRADRAVERFEEGWRIHAEWSSFTGGDCSVSAVEAYVRLRRADDARRLARQLADDVERGPIDDGHAALAAAFLAPVDELDARIGAALAVYERVGRPFWCARARLVYGERLRRAGRRVDARAQLEPALAAFETVGARPWADRAAAELRATGARIGRRSARRGDELTAQQLQVALRVARGLKNREVAEALFVSEKTVEKHLAAAYEKLGVRSRSELARLLAADDVRARLEGGQAAAPS